MKKLGFGLMRLPVRAKIPTIINLKEFKKMVDYFIEKGFTYFDTAYMYHGFRSEAAARKALVERHERCTFTLASKLPLMPMFIRTKEQQEAIFNKQLLKCGVEYFDYYLIHSLTAKSFEVAKKLDTFEFVLQKKAEGKIKHVGFSFHDKAAVLDEILTAHPEMEFVQLQLNYLDWESEKVQSKLCYEVAVKHGVPVVVMEPVKGGTLAKLPEKAEALLKEYNPNASVASWAIRYVASLDNVMMVLSGMSDMGQLKDNTAVMDDFSPLNDEERAVVTKAVEIIKGSITVPCTACGYCVAGCPKKISIPDCFALYNKAKQGDGNAQRDYKKLVKTHGAASACIGCKQCERACPQHLNIVDSLKDVAENFGK